MNQSDEVNTLIDELNEEYPFWHPHQDKNYSDEEEHHEDSIGVLDGTRQDILNIESNVKSENFYDSYYGLFKSKERIVISSLVS